MFCIQCGARIGTNIKFCPSCGANVGMANESPHEVANIRNGGIDVTPEGDVNVAGDVVGRDKYRDRFDVHGDVHVYNVPITPEVNLEQILSNAESLLLEREFEEATNLLDRTPEILSNSGRANFLMAIALAEGQHCNAIQVRKRERIEKCLKAAHKKEPNWALPMVLLAIWELDYYRLNGMVSRNEVSLDNTRSLLDTNRLSDNDWKLLRLTSPSAETKRRLGIS